VFVFANVLQPLVDFFEGILKAFHSTGMGWGMAIVCLTIVVRAALLPLTLKQFKSMQNLAKFQPQIKRLQEKYKDDKERLNQEMMKFYRENKVNPFASCLPLAAQLPVFLALFYMLRTDLRLDICPDVNPPGTVHPVPCGAGGEAKFLFIPDLTGQATGAVLITLIVLYVGSQLLSTILMSTATDKTQRMIFLALPFVFVVFVIRFPAGLLVYWITTNLWTIVQQTIVRKRLGPMRAPSADGEPIPMSIMDRMIHRNRPPDEVDGSAGGAAATPELDPPRPSKRPAAVAASGSGGSKPKAHSAAPPPPSPRKRKKRSGRRR
jgi:YidC/Oxa1 family membrane protein insertase